MSASVQRVFRAPIGALILIGIMSSPALAARQDDPAKAFIASLAGERDAGVPHDPGYLEAQPGPEAQPGEDAARRFIAGLAGKHDRPPSITAPEVDTRPERDFINRLAGRTP
ncbi:MULTISPECIES: hypothetical protein [Nitrospirillum]|uniref:DUF4148 domain-containing protein n=1 Tax=Nitrospirillum amazonense TaxID=28077 RepID=A0A560G7G6_9PROT|nr:hypothetical protein [Nitrospirillum amazonense]MEC4590312.1 hypothetical protein [Nitrospirillum amazonense]TWB29761.1 hypothetical protein FBZ88_103184 [Nitrospirillum amazonense]